MGDPGFRGSVEALKGEDDSNFEATNIRRGELLQKQVVLQLALQIARIQTEAVKGRFEGWEMVMDDVRQKVLTVVSEAQNPDPTEK